MSMVKIVWGMNELHISKLKFDACIFDLDGVITQTQDLHFLAWKKTFDEFLKSKKLKRRFTIRDYLIYVDGKPRIKGAESFLKTINIQLPLGRETDFGFNSIWGIANIKNKYFESILEKKGVKVFKSTLKFIWKLKKNNFKLAVISASKHCKAILRKANIENFFDTIIDGNDAEKLGLKGKPDPDIFEEAAKRLGVKKERCIIVEDSVAGIKAGKRGGFGLLIGIDRGGNRDALLNAGADIVVKSLDKLNVIKVNVEGKNELIKRIEGEMGKGKKIFLFTDYDGTLTPIVDKPELAILDEDMKKILQSLTRKINVTVVSGRSLADIKKLVSLKNIYYSGNHGFEIEVGDKKIELKRARKFLPLLSEAEEMLKKIKINGLLLEKKKYSLAFHYRLVKAEEAERIKKRVKEVAEKLGLKLKYGKKVIELMPRIRWDKGEAIKWIIKNLNIDVKNSLIIYMGDDLTDEDAFKAVNAVEGVSILVVSKDAYETTSAKYFLKGIEEVREFLSWLAQNKR